MERKPGPEGRRVALEIAERLVKEGLLTPEAAAQALEHYQRGEYEDADRVVGQALHEARRAVRAERRRKVAR